MNKRYVYYLSSKMTGINEYNYPAFNRIAEKLRAKGLQILNPAEINQVVPHKKRSDYLRDDIQHLLRCDALILFGDWENSKGALLELANAKELGMDIFIFNEDENSLLAFPCETDINVRM